MVVTNKQISLVKTTTSVSELLKGVGVDISASRRILFDTLIL
jgi:hypothetical protein